MKSSGEKGVEDIQPHRHPAAKGHQDASGRLAANGTNLSDECDRSTAARRQAANGMNPSDECDRSTASTQHHHGG